MRGGAIPLLVWGTILAVLYIGHAIWDGQTVPTLETGFAVLVIYGGAAALFLSRRDAIKTGPPPPSFDPEAEPAASAAAMLMGLSLGCILFGVVWARFLVYFGIAMLVVSLGRLALELRAQRDSQARLARQATSSPEARE